jgi:hypothetical protein
MQTEARLEPGDTFVYDTPGRRRLRKTRRPRLRGQLLGCLGDRPGGSGGLDHLVDGRLDCLSLAGALVGEVGEAVPHGLGVD